MNINIYCIGKIKEAYWEDAINEYKKRLGKYVMLNIYEFKDYPTPTNSSPSIEEEIKSKECAQFLTKIKENTYTCALDLNNKQLDSVSFAAHLNEMLVKGKGTLNFLIGGSLGLSKEAKEKANESITISKMTFPHQLCRVILIEQIYRAFRILNNEPYHK